MQEFAERATDTSRTNDRQGVGHAMLG
jgi:hypothetical protein